jgi:hypothetical protein
MSVPETTIPDTFSDRLTPKSLVPFAIAIRL